jgi:hypothetical protein
VLLAREAGVLANPAIWKYADTLEGYMTKVGLWTDDYSNLFQILK